MSMLVAKFFNFFSTPSRRDPLSNAYLIRNNKLFVSERARGEGFKKAQQNLCSLLLDR
jgi:hypothetical protein